MPTANPLPPSDPLSTPVPTRDEEFSLYRQGYSLVAGVDEVGRGPLAGPVMAAAVILPQELEAPWLPLVRDSKALSSAQREWLLPRIQEEALAVGVGLVEPAEIDTLGIVAATRKAMGFALSHLPPQPHYLLVDALPLHWRGVPCKALIKGDARCTAIAAASIVAKVTRDHFMQSQDILHPGYGFARHKGYATPEHLIALQRLGPSAIHRRSFAPVRALATRVPYPFPSPLRHRLGTSGERVAEAYLISLGYGLRARNYRCPYGEVDLVAQEGEYVVFVEVRTRRSSSYGTPEESITSAKAKRLVSTAQSYLQEHGLEVSPWRIDLVIVEARGGEPTIRHFPYAITLP